MLIIYLHQKQYFICIYYNRKNNINTNQFDLSKDLRPELNKPFIFLDLKSGLRSE